MSVVPQRALGSQGLVASAQGLGCMVCHRILFNVEPRVLRSSLANNNVKSSLQGMTAFYGNFDRDAQEEESLKTIATALDLGINLLDTAWIYQVSFIIFTISFAK